MDGYNLEVNKTNKIKIVLKQRKKGSCSHIEKGLSKCIISVFCGVSYGLHLSLGGEGGTGHRRVHQGGGRRETFGCSLAEGGLGGEKGEAVANSLRQQ
jgi:hypothetical protein